VATEAAGAIEGNVETTRLATATKTGLKQILFRFAYFLMLEAICQHIERHVKLP